MGYSLWVCKESDMTEVSKHACIHTVLNCQFVLCSSSSTSLAVGLYVSICFSLKSLEVLFPKALK